MRRPAPRFCGELAYSAFIAAAMLSMSADMLASPLAASAIAAMGLKQFLEFIVASHGPRGAVTCRECQARQTLGEKP